MTRQLSNLGQRGAGLITGIISFIFGAIITILALRLVFRMFSANPNNGIVDWVYDISQPFVQPFFGIFRTDTIDLATGRFEIETLVALIVYGLIGALLTGLFGGRRGV